MSAELVPPAATKGRYGVYLLYDADGQLLYVGRTSDLPARIASHGRTQPWWPSVARLEWVAVADYGESVALERATLAHDCPPHNQVGTKSLPPGRHPLPDEVQLELVRLCSDADDESVRVADSYMRALREAGWTLTAIGSTVGLTRERVRQRVAAADGDSTISVPRFVKPTSKPTRKVWPMPTEDETRRLRELSRLASRVRGRTPADSPNRKASDEYIELCVELLMRGVRERDVAATVGLKPGSIRMRLKSRGYLKLAPSMTAYGSINPARRDECQQGHPLSGENLRLINGDPTRRRCRECERTHQRRYLQRRRAAA